MRVERSYLVRIVQVYEGEPPADWGDLDALVDRDGNLYGAEDQYICDNWQMVDERHEYLDDDQLETVVWT